MELILGFITFLVPHAAIYPEAEAVQEPNSYLHGYHQRHHQASFTLSTHPLDACQYTHLHLVLGYLHVFMD